MATAGRSLHQAGDERTQGGGRGRAARQSRPGPQPRGHHAQPWPLPPGSEGGLSLVSRLCRAWPQREGCLGHRSLRIRWAQPSSHMGRSQRVVQGVASGVAGMGRGRGQAGPGLRSSREGDRGRRVCSGKRPDPSAWEDTRGRRPGPATVWGERRRRVCTWMELARGRLRVLGS